MKNGRSLLALATELERQLAHKKDMIVPTALMRHQTSDDSTCTLVIDERGGAQPYGITELARRQLADRLGIPVAYFERMRIEQPALLDHNINTWLHDGSIDRRLIRILDGQVRAILSERYRRLDNIDLAEHVLPILQRLPDAQIASAELTATRMYLKVVTRLSAEVVPGDIVQAGVVVSNSEVGAGSLAVQPLLFRLLCRNGLIASDYALRKTHVGRIQAAADEAVVVFQDDTLRADDHAFFLKARDVVQAAVSEVSFQLLVQRLRATRTIRLAADPVQAVTVLAQRYSLNDGERSGVLRHLIGNGEWSGYGLINAVTGYAQDVEDYDRATELEALGGRLVELPSRDWKGIADSR